MLGWEEETLLSERQVEEEEENKKKETAFLVTRTDRQTLAFVGVGESFFKEFGQMSSMSTKLKCISLGD